MKSFINILPWNTELSSENQFDWALSSWDNLWNILVENCNCNYNNRERKSLLWLSWSNATFNATLYQLGSQFFERFGQPNRIFLKNHLTFCQQTRQKLQKLKKSRWKVAKTTHCNTACIGWSRRKGKWSGQASCNFTAVNSLLRKTLFLLLTLTVKINSKLVVENVVTVLTRLTVWHWLRRLSCPVYSMGNVVYNPSYYQSAFLESPPAARCS